jgi:hypothetical protein
MAFSPINIPQLQQSRPIVDKEGRPAPDFIRVLNDSIQSLKASFNSLLALPDIQAAITAAQTAADNANTAAATANSAATSAETAVSQTNAYPTGLTISATDAGTSATIFISAFTEVYPQTNGSNVSVSVNSGSITGLAYSTTYWIYYDDPTRAGGAVTYHATTTQATAAQTGDRIAVGAVTTPAAAGAPVSGKFRLAPGTVEP